jgi:hypothetical protein
MPNKPVDIDMHDLGAAGVVSGSLLMGWSNMYTLPSVPTPSTRIYEKREIMIVAIKQVKRKG